MLNDGYAEHIVKANTPKGVIAAMVAGVVLCILGVLSMMMYVWGIVVLAVGIVIFYLAFSSRETEYEYLMVNDDIEISRIIAKKARKKEYSFSNSDVKYIVKQGSIYLDNEIQSNQNGHIKMRNYASRYSDNADNIYVFVINCKNGTEFVSLELSDKTIEHVNNFFKGKYKEY
ncbi:MAG: DUF6106 family protein [Coprococcus sp.]